MTDVVWSTELLRVLRAPETPANYAFLNSWAQREHNGGPALSDGSNNPFFTTAGAGSTVGPFKSGLFPRWNSIGVAKYPNLEVGVAANAYHIATGYPSIAAALKSGNPASFANNPGFQSDLRRWSGAGYTTVAGLGGASTPVGPTVSTDAMAHSLTDLVRKSSGSGLGGVAGAVNSAARHIPGVAQVEGAAGATADAAGAVAGFVRAITDPHNILRGLQIIAGAALVGTGAVLLARQVALAADLPDPALLMGPAGKVGTAAAGAASGASSRRRERESSEREEAAFYEGQAAGRRAKVDRLRLDRDADRGARSSEEIPF